MSGKQLQFLILHCTATPEGREIFPDDILRWHTDPCEKDGKFLYMGKVYERVEDLPSDVQPRHRRGRGWKVPGYADLILINAGLLINITRYNDDDIVDPWEITNGATGINGISRHLVYAGGCDKSMRDKDTRTPAQTETMKMYVRNFIKKYPHAKVAGHNQFAAKACPSFNAPEWLRSIGVAEENIYQPNPE